MKKYVNLLLYTLLLFSLVSCNRRPESEPATINIKITNLSKQNITFPFVFSIRGSSDSPIIISEIHQLALDEVYDKTFDYREYKTDVGFHITINNEDKTSHYITTYDNIHYINVTLEIMPGHNGEFSIKGGVAIKRNRTEKEWYPEEFKIKENVS